MLIEAITRTGPSEPALEPRYDAAVRDTVREFEETARRYANVPVKQAVIIIALTGWDKEQDKSRA